jgi:hypothetical protein
MDRSGRVWVGAELALEYGVKDIDGTQPPSYSRTLGKPRKFSDAVVG